MLSAPLTYVSLAESLHRSSSGSQVYLTAWQFVG